MTLPVFKITYHFVGGTSYSIDITGDFEEETASDFLSDALDTFKHQKSLSTEESSNVSVAVYRTHMTHITVAKVDTTERRG